ncbi:unnamed protein product, partial [Prorocentrum cordatum]
GRESRGAGGLAVLVPGLARAERDQLRDDAAAGRPPSLLKPAISPCSIVDGRLQLIAINCHNSDREIRVLNVHHYILSDARNIRLRDAWATRAQWSNSDPLRFAFTAMGDFNFADVPSQSHLIPQASQRRLTVEGRSRQNRSFWRQVTRSNVVEISPDTPTRFSKRHQAGTTIDGLNVAPDSFTLSDMRLSDHAIIMLAIETRRPPAKGQCPIPDFVFRSKQYKPLSAKMPSGAELGAMADPRRYDVTKQIMIMAAELARDGPQRLPLGTGGVNALE